MTDQPKRGKRVQIYLPADLVERWEETPRYERSAEVAKALRAWWKTDSTPPPRGARGETEETNMNEHQKFQQAIDDRDWFTVTRMVMEYTTEPTTDKYGADELQDWLSNGDWHGEETPQSVAAEWDELSRQSRDL